MNSEESESGHSHRPCGISEILGRAARLYQQQFGGLLGLSLFCLAVPECIGLAVGSAPWNNLDSSVVWWIASLLRIAADCLFQGAVTLVCALGLVGVKTGILNVVRQVRPALFLRLLGTALVQAVFLLFLYLALIVPGVIYSVRWAFSMHLVVLERRVYRDALQRGSELLRFNFWRLVGIKLPTIVLFWVAIFGGVFDPENGIRILIFTVVDSLLSPQIAIAVTSLYFDIRARQGGLSLEEIRKMIGLEGDIEEWGLRWERP